jgi:hypothetical protein
MKQWTLRTNSSDTEMTTSYNRRMMKSRNRPDPRTNFFEYRVVAAPMDIEEKSTQKTG